MPPDPRHEILFEPIRVGPKTFRNRFYVVPHCSGLGVEYPGAQAYLRAMRAEGGWAAVNTEYCAVHAESDDAPWVQARLLDDRDVANLSLMCERVHDHGALAGVQLVYMGPEHTGHGTRLPAGGPSQLGSALFGHSCYELTKPEIRQIQQAYVDAAIRARRCGFDLVQIAGREAFFAPFHFISRYWNKRTDEYGGPIENRVRFWRETLERVGEAVGDDCAIVCGFCLDTLGDGGEDAFRIEEDGIAAVALLDDVVDLWDVQVGRLGDDVGSSRFFEQFWQRSYIEQIRAHTSKPIVAVGRFTDPDVMADAVRSGVVDIIGAARPAIADPFIPEKIRDGRVDDIRECIGCNICVSRFNNGGGRIICTQNATCGEEYRRAWHPERFAPACNAATPILVVGAGPAGMECATVLGRRGMELVHLVDAAPEIGGAMTWIPTLPGLQQWRRVVDWRQTQLDRLRNVAVVTGARLTAADVRDYGAEIVILATGSHWDATGLNPVTHRPIAGADAALPHVLTPEQLVVERKPVPGSRVVVVDYDGYYMAASLADLLARDGKQVTLVTAADQVAATMFFTDEGDHMIRSLLRNGVTLCPSHVVTSVEPGAVHGCYVYDESVAREWEADAVVLVTQRVSDDRLFRDLAADPAALEKAGVRAVHRIGDCLEPRIVADAIFDGHRLAREIDTDDPAVPLPFIREQRILNADNLDYDAVLTGREPHSVRSTTKEEVV